MRSSALRIVCSASPPAARAGPAGRPGAEAQQQRPPGWGQGPARARPRAPWGRWRPSQRTPRSRHHPGHAEADPDRHPRVPRRRSALRGRGVQHRGGRPGAVRPVPAARPGLVHRPGAGHERPAALPGLARAQRPGPGGRQGLSRPDGRLAAEVQAVGRLVGPAAGRPALRRRCGRLAPPRPPGRRPRLRAADRREGLLRHPGRVRRRDRPQGQPQQAPGHHGPGRRQYPPAQPGQGAGADAALQPDPARNHLHAVHRRPAARVPAQHRDRPARSWSATSPT